MPPCRERYTCPKSAIRVGVRTWVVALATPATAKPAPSTVTPLVPPLIVSRSSPILADTALAAKQAPAMFGKPLTKAQLLERFQSCLKTSAQGVKFVKLKATLANVRFWDCEGKRAEAPGNLRGRRILAAAQPRQLWVMNQQCGLLLELRDVKLDEGVEECPL